MGRRVGDRKAEEEPIVELSATTTTPRGALRRTRSRLKIYWVCPKPPATRTSSRPGTGCWPGKGAGSRPRPPARGRPASPAGGAGHLAVPGTGLTQWAGKPPAGGGHTGLIGARRGDGADGRHVRA